MSTAADRFPPQIKYIVWNEGAERFSFYGMRSILTVYMASYLAFPEHEAKGNYHLFLAICYLTPLLGAFLADRVFGRYRIILWVSLGYVFGHALMAAWETRWGLFFALSFIALGSGGIKPCVSALVGDQFKPEQSGALQRVYNLFYWMINLGSVTSTLLIPVLFKRYGPSVAFAVPGLFMVVALAIFFAGRKQYVRMPPAGPDPHSFVRVVWTALNRIGTRPGHWLDGALHLHPPAAVDGAKAVFRIMGVFVAVTAFWALFDQHGSSWVLQAQRMDLQVWGYTLQASQLSALNPWMVLLIIPFFSVVLFPLLEKAGLKVTPLGKMSVGMFVTVLSFVAATVVDVLLASGMRPNALWQIPQYLLLTAAEVLVSVTGLEFSYTQAPRSMKSTIMSIWFLTIFAGNMLTGLVSKLNFFQGWGYFAFFSLLMLAAAVGFALIARRYQPYRPPEAA
ncbi:MAG: POT family MFS transporter [Deltaproteobacteria bacterium]|nr:POT family MFS transporter [Deltaproteobacteria bacterium]